MSDIILYTIIILTCIAVVAAIILFFVAKQFKVYEDPRIDEVEEALPNANCGGCGFPGCRAFAETCCKADSLDNLLCPPGGTDTMKKVAGILGMEAAEKEPQIAVLRCNGTAEHRAKTSSYDGAENCTIVSNLFGGESDCSYGCLGLGECVDACGFDAMYMDPDTHLPVVIEDKCTACGACVQVCPKNLFELRNKGKKSKRIFVSCMNLDKGGEAKKACDVACIGCSKCFKACDHNAIVMENNKAYIDYEACKMCRACVPVCPTGAIHELNFPARKQKPAAEKKKPIKKDVKPKSEEKPVEKKIEAPKAKEQKEPLAQTEIKEKVVENTATEVVNDSQINKE